MHTFRPYLISARNFIAIATAVMIALGGPFVEAASAATRYVNIGGVDTGVCTTASPGCASIGYAMLNSVSGDIIQVGPGVYNTTTGESFPIYPKDGVRISGAGNAGRGTATVCGDANTSCLDNGGAAPSSLVNYNTLTTNPANTILEGFILKGAYIWGKYIYTLAEHHPSPRRYVTTQ